MSVGFSAARAPATLPAAAETRYCCAIGAAIRPLDGRTTLAALDLDRLRATPLCRDPYDFVVVEHFLRPEHVAPVLDDFPPIARHGSFPVDVLDPPGPAFKGLLAELAGPELRAAIAEKFAIDLDGRPTMVTLRGRGDGRDGGVHTDSATKLITMLLYLNPSWDEPGGRLRVLRSRALDDYAAEIVPVAGTMLAFRRGERSYHGHLPHRGERRVLQLNWVTDERVVRRELRRHRLSAWIKRLVPFA